MRFRYKRCEHIVSQHHTHLFLRIQLIVPNNEVGRLERLIEPLYRQMNKEINEVQRFRLTQS